MAAVAERPPEPSEAKPASTSRASALTLVLALCACAGEQPAAQRVEAFCSAIQRGESIEAVRARYPEFDLQPGGRPPDAASKAGALVSAADLPTLSAVLAEPAGSPEGARPVCAIYYSDAFKGGSNAVILAEFKADWVGRY